MRNDREMTDVDDNFGTLRLNTPPQTASAASFPRAVIQGMTHVSIAAHTPHRVAQ
jgi:hypothetical protein